MNMKKNRIGFVFALLVSLLLLSCGKKVDANGWYTDFSEAQKAAKSKNKYILLFVNSMYDDESTSDGVKLLTQTSEFTKAVAEDFVCVHFDFNSISSVMGKSLDGLTGKEQKALEKEQGAIKAQLAVADRYAVRDTPCAVVVSKEGFYITQINFDYLDTSVSGYKGCLYLEIGTIQDFEENLKKARKGTVEDRMAAYDEIFGSVEEMVQPAMVSLWREAMNLDKNNVSGSVGKFIMTCASVDAFEKINVRKFDEGVEVFKKYSEDSRLTGVEKQTLLFYAAQVLISSGNSDYDKVVSILQSAFDADPESQYAETLKKYISEVENYKNKADEAAANSK